MTIKRALLTAIASEMQRDQRVFYMSTAGELVLENEFGTARSRRTPISENAVVGIAVGAAMCGQRPIVNLRPTCFSFSAFDQLVNQAAKATYMSGGQCSIPLVVRMSLFDRKQSAAQHSQSGYALYAHAGGLKIIAPSTPADALGLMMTAIRTEDPVLCFESAWLEGATGDVPDNPEAIRLGSAMIRRAGSDVTIIGISNTVSAALTAADQLAQSGISAEVIDPRSLVPLDIATIRESVRKTGRLVIVDESSPTCSFAAEIAMQIVEDPAAFAGLRGPVRRVCNKPVPIPFSPLLEDFVLPGPQDVVAAVNDLLATS